MYYGSCNFIHTWSIGVVILFLTCSEGTQCWEISILTSLSSDSSRTSCLWRPSCVMQVTKNVFSVTTCCALFVLLLFVCLIEWLVDKQFISTEIRHLCCCHWHHNKMAALNTSALYDSVAVIYDICEKKLHVDKMAAFLILSNCLRTFWRRLCSVLALWTCNVFCWFEKHLNCVCIGI